MFLRKDVKPFAKKVWLASKYGQVITRVTKPDNWEFSE